MKSAVAAAVVLQKSLSQKGIRARLLSWGKFSGKPLEAAVANFFSLFCHKCIDFSPLPRLWYICIDTRAPPACGRAVGTFRGARKTGTGTSSRRRRVPVLWDIIRPSFPLIALPDLCRAPLTTPCQLRPCYVL
jgi:hypothetical protein